MFRTLRPSGSRISTSRSSDIPELFSPYHQLYTQSGTAALAAALSSVKKLRTDISSPEVILPAYCCPDLISALIFTGIKPVLIDFEKNTPWLDLVKLDKTITSSTIAILAVNFLGIQERIGKIREIISSRNIMIIEDSAQGFPINNDNYWQGDLIILSFSRGKPINTLSGGVVLSQNKSLISCIPKLTAEEKSTTNNIIHRLKALLFNFLISPPIYYWINKFFGKQFGTTTYKELLELKQLNPTNRSFLGSNVKKYFQQSRLDTMLSRQLKEIQSDQLIDIPRICSHNYSQPLLRYPILIKDDFIRNKILTSFENNGLGCNQLYKQTIPNIKNIPNGFINTGSIQAEVFARQLITIPLHDDVRENDIISIINIIKSNLSI